jgi:type I restriction enzyme S subunit
MYQRIDANEAENSNLESLRDTLLPKLMSGEVRVPEVEEMIGV